jgi:hypothetical protein
MDIPATFADKAKRCCIGPIEIEKARDRGVELAFAPIEFVVAADLAPQEFSGDLVAFGIVSEHAESLGPGS